MKARINININLEIGDFRMETSLGPTLAEFMHGPGSVHRFQTDFGPVHMDPHSQISVSDWEQRSWA